MWIIKRKSKTTGEVSDHPEKFPSERAAQFYMLILISQHSGYDYWVEKV